MQNAICASVIDSSPSVRLISTKNINNATPIRISGIAIGANTITGNTRPGRWYSAKPAIVPNVVATSEVTSAISSELPAAVSIASLCISLAYHAVVKATHSALIFESLKENTTTTASGAYRNT